MASFQDRLADNVLGKLYVDKSCIYCDLCVQTAPALFREQTARGWAYVQRQPQTEQEFEYAMKALEGCPTESIGCDGDLALKGKSPRNIIARLLDKLRR